MSSNYYEILDLIPAEMRDAASIFAHSKDMPYTVERQHAYFEDLRSHFRADGMDADDAESTALQVCIALSIPKDRPNY